MVPFWFNLTMLVVSLFMVIPTEIDGSTSPISGAPGAAASASCPVTLPRKAPLAPSDARKMVGASTAHWSGALFVGGLWPDGTIVFRSSGPGFVLPDGSLSMKFGWFRGSGLRGKLSIEGKRLDAPAPPLRASIPDGYGDTGFQSSALIFPTEGCWEIVGQVGNTRLTFVTRVVKEI